MSGMFITFEGGEGAGKSTHMASVCQWLIKKGKSVISTREPGGTEIGERVRDVLLHSRNLGISIETETLLMFAARAEHLACVIKPALDQGKIVLCDRFTDATYAYQGGGRGLPLEQIAILEHWVQGNLRPDLTFLLDLPIETGLMRAGRRGLLDRFEREDRAFFDRVRSTYAELAEREPKRFRIIDATGNEAEVRQKILIILEEAIHG